MSVIDDINKKRKKEKTLLKDVKGSQMVSWDKPIVGTPQEAREVSRTVGQESYINTGEGVINQGTRSANEPPKSWKDTMAENRKRYAALAAKYPGDTIYGAESEEPQMGLPESIAYLDGTVQKKVAKPTAEQTAAVPAATKEKVTAVKEETPAEQPAAQPKAPVTPAKETSTPAAQPVTETKSETTEQTPAAQSRYDKAIAYINEASKAPSRRERRDIRKMEKAAKKLIEDGKIREPIAFERDLDEVEVVADKNPTPQTPAKETSTPAAQPAATTTQQEAAKDEVPAQPATIAQQTASEDTPEQMTYTELLKRFYPVMTPEEKAEQQRRQRNRQIINAVGDGISALANLYYTNKSGVNAYDPSTSLTKAAKERYDKLLAQQREDENRHKELAYRSGVADLEMAYKRARDAKADADAEVEDGYKKSKEDREIAESNARIKKDEAWTKYYESLANLNNNGGKTKTGSKSSTTNKPYLIGDDGKAVYYDSVQDAFAELPPEYKRRAETLEEKKQAIANYNARKRTTAKASSKKNGGNKTSGKTIADEDYSQYIVE